MKVAGALVGGVKPLITIDETNTGATYGPANWTPPGYPCAPNEVHAVVVAETDAILKNFRIDGRMIQNTSPTLGGDFPGVFVPGIQGFEIIDCEIRGFHDQVCIDPGGEGSNASVSISGGLIADSFPLVGDKGHSAIWVLGPGNSNVTIDGTTFSGNHDAIETDPGSSTSMLDFTLTGCFIEDNENGFEGVGSGTQAVLIDSCMFQRNFPRTGGIDPYQKAVFSLLFRADAMPACVLRRNKFINNTGGILWQIPADGMSRLDMGTDTTMGGGLPDSPGENSFCLDYDIDFQSHDPFITDLYFVGVRVTDSAPVFASGNYWLPDNQGASSNRILKIGEVAGPANTSPMYPNGGCEASGVQVERNYSILAGGHINFGNVDPPFNPAPPPCTACDQ